jgi:trehalose-phosphatase
MDEAPPSKEAIQDFLNNLSTFDKRIIMTDYDGTLAPFTTERDKAVIYPQLQKVLKKIIASTKSELIIISGRSVSEIRDLLNLTDYPEIWGSHGCEKMSQDDNVSMKQLEQSTSDLINSAKSICENDYLLSEHIEKKPYGLAIHWRGLASEEIQNIHRRSIEILVKFTAEGSLDLISIDQGLELRPSCCNKGTAVMEILKRYESCSFTAAYLGDDITDEDAFAAISGRGLGVLVRNKWRRTKATAWLKPPEELLAFLEHWI